jgi:hypothetical protein
VVLLIFWIRGTYPRLRIDQLMSFGWKMLVPLSFMNIVASAVVLFYGWPIWALSAISLLLLAGALYIIAKRPGSSLERQTVTVYSAKSLMTPRAAPPPAPEPAD